MQPSSRSSTNQAARYTRRAGSRYSIQSTSAALRRRHAQQAPRLDRPVARMVAGELVAHELLALHFRPPLRRPAAARALRVSITPYQLGREVLDGHRRVFELGLAGDRIDHRIGERAHARIGREGAVPVDRREHHAARARRRRCARAPPSSPSASARVASSPARTAKRSASAVLIST